MKNYLLLLAVAASVSLTSCDKDDDTVTTKSKTELLTAGAWKGASLTVNPAIDWDGDGTKETDLTQFVDACSLDDLTIFKADKTYTEEEGASKCTSTDPQVIATGTWAFNGDESAVLLTETGSTTAETYNIAELTANSLKYTESFTDTANVTYTFTSSFTH